VHLAAKSQLPGGVLFWSQLAYASRRSSNEVGDAVTPFRQSIVVQVRQRLRNEAGAEKQLPEPIREAREMVTRERRSHARIDSDEEDTNSRTDPVAE
jgi:hypothetical protein